MKSIISKKNLIRLISFLFWVSFLGALYFHNKSENHISVKFDAAIHSSATKQNIGEFYYDTGKGFNEAESVKFTYYQEADGNYYPMRVILPISTLKQLRFDPLPAEGWISIKNFTIQKYYPKKIHFKRSSHMLVPQHSIAEITVENGQVSIISNGNDPFLILLQDVDLLSLSDYKLFFNYVSVDKFIAGISALLLMAFLITRFSVE